MVAAVMLLPLGNNAVTLVGLSGHAYPTTNYTRPNRIDYCAEVRAESRGKERSSNWHGHQSSAKSMEMNTWRCLCFYKQLLLVFIKALCSQMVYIVFIDHTGNTQQRIAPKFHFGNSAGNKIDQVCHNASHRIARSSSRRCWSSRVRASAANINRGQQLPSDASLVDTGVNRRASNDQEPAAKKVTVGLTNTTQIHVPCIRKTFPRVRERALQTESENHDKGGHAEKFVTWGDL